jgi:hypothetical protein
MGEIASCFFNPGACIDGAVASWLAWYPFGIEGVKATVWMIVGAVLGKFGVGAVIALALALKVAGKTPEVHEHVVGHDAAPPIPAKKKRKTFLG